MADEPLKITSRKIIDAASRYADAQSTIDELKPVLFEAMGEHRRAIAGNRVIKVSVTAASPAVPEVVITKSMIGQKIKARPARGERKGLTVE